jgi:hypothetical protein
MRTEITSVIVTEALKRASLAKDSKDLYDYYDTRQRYLQLRQRGYRVGWFVRAKRRTRRLGSARKAPGEDYLSLSQARHKAGETFFAMKPRGALKLASNPGWTWSDLDRQFQAALKEVRKKGRKIKEPRRSSQDDVKSSFKNPELLAWRKIRLANLTDLHLIGLIGEVHQARGYRACEKLLAYVKAALSWARSERTLESGLAGTMPWWTAVKAPQPTAEEIRQMKARRHARVNAKEMFTVKHLGELLVRHERFCAARTGNEKISPAVRWGIWWLCLTANRRLTLAKLERDDLADNDPQNPYSSPTYPWGVATWPAGGVKNGLPFMLPIPPIGLHIAKSCTWDLEHLVAKKRGFRSRSKWLFASTRRRSRRDHPDNPDPGLYPNSLDAHLRAMRGKKGKNTENYLDGLPPFWPHLVRSVATNFFARELETVPPAAASVMLGHALPNDRGVDWLEMSETTKEFYLTAQHMHLKARAMKTWSEALMKAYVEAGGTLPMPYEKHPDKPKGPGWISPRLPQQSAVPTANQARAYW